MSLSTNSFTAQQQTSYDLAEKSLTVLLGRAQVAVDDLELRASSIAKVNLHPLDRIVANRLLAARDNVLTIFSKTSDALAEIKDLVENNSPPPLPPPPPPSHSSSNLLLVIGQRNKAASIELISEDFNILLKRFDAIREEHSKLLEEAISVHAKNLIQFTKSPIKISSSSSSSRENLTNLSTKNHQLHQQQGGSNFGEGEKRFNNYQEYDNQNDLETEETPLLRKQQFENNRAREIEENELAFRESLINERDNEIQNIESGVHLVHEVFNKIGKLVAIQGQSLDHIEANMESTVVNADGGVEQLVIANSHGRRLKSCKWWTFIILFFILAILIMILIFKGGK